MENGRIILKISNAAENNYLDLPSLLRSFSYPVSLELSEWIGARIYQKGYADPLEFLTIMVNKFFTRIEKNPNSNILEEFITKEGKSIEDKSRILVSLVKKYEVGSADSSELSSAITHFCRCTHGVRLPMVSFFLRMLLPTKFGTLDVHCISALKSLGFKVKEIPSENMSKDAYLKQYDGLDYVEYNSLITETGKHYKIASPLGGFRFMTPAEVDMALFEYDKERGGLNIRTTRTDEKLSKEEKIKRIMTIVQEIADGTRKGPLWVQRAGEKFLLRMNLHAKNNDLDSMLNYYNALADGTAGRDVGEWLQNQNLPSIESQAEKVRRIFRS